MIFPLKTGEHTANVWLILFSIVINLIESDGFVEGHAGHADENDGLPKVPQASAQRPTTDDFDFGDASLTRNAEHIKEELKKYLSNINQTDFMMLSQEQLRFYYFEFHDFDKNGKLDGLEILRAMIHMVEHHSGKSFDDATLAGAPDDIKYGGIIDKIFNANDRDQDGFLSYDEFVYAQGGGH